jgi:cytohesin
MVANEKEMAKFLVGKGFEHSAVHVAAFLGDLDKVKSYLSAGGDINARSPSWFTLLICATMGGHAEEVEFIIGRGADINLKGSEGRSALGWATIRAYDDPSETRVEIARMLLDKGADMTIPDSINRRTAWLWAALLGRIDIVEAMLTKGIDVNTKSGIYIARGGISDEDWTALHEACRAGRVGVVEVLIAHGADVNTKTKKGETPMSLAKKGYRNSEQVIELLRKHGAKE